MAIATATARRHVARALRELLMLPMSRIAGITSRFDNGWTIDGIGYDVRGCVARMTPWGEVEVVLPGDDGEDQFVASIVLERADRVRWDAAEEARLALLRGIAERDETLADEATPRHIDGTILAVAVVGRRVSLLVDVDGVETEMSMMKLMDTPDALADYASISMGIPSRLHLERTDEIHRAVGIPAGMPVVEIIGPIVEDVLLAA